MHLEFTGLGRGASNENHEIISLNRYDRRGQYFSSTHSNKIIKTKLAKSRSLLKYTYVLKIINRKILNVEIPHRGRNSEEFCASGSHGLITDRDISTAILLVFIRQ